MTNQISTNSDNASSAMAQTKAIDEETTAAPPLPGQPGAFATRSKLVSSQPLKQNKIVLFGGVACITVLLLFVLISFPSHNAKVP
jgi:hypothetical protein